MPQIAGKLIKVMEPVSGERDGKVWVRTQFAIIAMDDNHQIVAFDVFGEDRARQIVNMRYGETMVVEYEPESHEFGLKYYTTLRCRRFSVLQAVQQKIGG